MLVGADRQASHCSSQEIMMIKSRPGAKEPGVESQPSSYSMTLGNLLARSACFLNFNTRLENHYVSEWWF